jgi:Uma2 family endonuclease
MPAAKLERRPTYEMLDLIPQQGSWSEREYLALETNRIVEFTDGFLEFLPMPDEIHQDINAFIFDLVRSFLRQRKNGVAKHCPFKVKINAKNYREPDVCVLLDSDSPHRGLDYWNYADIVFEVVSASNPERDYEQKRVDYASAGVPEYWIIDPRVRRITLLKLENGVYVEVGVFSDGHQVRSFMMPELLVDVLECFDAGNSAVENRKPQSEMQ